MSIRTRPTLITAIFVVIILLLLTPTLAHAAPITNTPVTVTQPDGSVLQLFASGDEYYNWLHDADGYTIIQDPDSGYYVYADLVDGVLAPTGLIAGRSDPAAAGLAPELNISPEQRTEIRREFEAKSQSMGPAVNAPRTGTITNLVVSIRFSGEPEFTTTTSTYTNMLNTAATSLRSYYLEASYNTLTINSNLYPTPGSTIISYQDSHTRGYFQPYNASTNPGGYTGGDDGLMRMQREHDLLRAAILYVNGLGQFPGGATIDADGDGNVDSMTFIIYGSPTGWSSLLWPHQWSFYPSMDGYTVTINGKTVREYQFELQSVVTSGVLAHEEFHLLGAPDLYHYVDNGIQPVGGWDVMEVDGTPPQHMSCYMKYKYGGWITLQVLTVPGTRTVYPLGTSSTNNCFRINSPASSTEFFVVEYRQATGTFESSLPGTGLLVYRINSAAVGNAYGPPDEVYLYRPGGTTVANGNLNTAYFNSAAGRTAINDSTNPSSFLSSGAAGRLNIFNISAAGSTMTFSYAAAGAPGVTTLISPSGTVTTPLPTYTWNAVSGATQYYLWVDGPGGVNVVDAFYTPAQAGCPGGTGTCSITPTSPLTTNGVHTWWVQARNGSGNGPWSYSLDFVASLPGLTAATLIAPTGSINTGNPTYSWNAVSGATQYYLWVDGPSGNRIKQWYTATEAGCPSGTGTCSATPATALTVGAHTWWIQTKNGSTNGPWSTPMTFTVVPATPPAATLVSPSGALYTTNTPTYTWNAVSNSTWYYLWVDGPSGNLIKQWYTAAEAGCPSGTGTCSITHAKVLANGAHTWWIQTWNSFGVGPWSAPKAFTVSLTAPPAATLISPTGTIENGLPTYTWNAVSNSTWYYLWVDGPSGNAIKKWYTAAEAGCASGTGTCSITPSGILTNGLYTWWIQTWNSYGNGAWSSGMQFTITMPPPPAATLQSPNGDIYDGLPTYYWDAVSNATRYFLWVTRPSGNAIKQWYTAAEAGCASGTGTCSITPSYTLYNGEHIWWIQTWNSAGDGPWSSSMAFTVNGVTNAFDSQFNGSAPDWEAHTGTWGIDSSQWYTTTGMLNSFASASYYSTFSDFQYEARLWREGCNGCATSLWVRGTPNPLQSAGGSTNLWQTGYLFEYSRDGYYSVWRVDPGSSTELQTWTYTSALNQGNAWNTLRVAANGSTLYFHINGVPVWAGTDTTYEMGKVGIAMYRDNTSGNQLWVDYATLTEGIYYAPPPVSAGQQAMNNAAGMNAGQCRDITKSCKAPLENQGEAIKPTPPSDDVPGPQ